MKTLRNILGVVATGAAALAFGGCASTSTSARSNLTDDLYTTHSREAIAERQRLIAEEEAAQARAQEALVKARLGQAGIRDAELILDTYDAGDLVENSYRGAYERRLRGEASQVYNEGNTYSDLLRDAGDKKTAYNLDASDYNLMVMGDEVWLEPKYITSFYGRWNNRGRFSLNFGINSLYDPFWDSPYYYWRDRGYWANNYYWDPYWGYRRYGYDPWWDWNFGWALGWPYDPYWSFGWGYRPWDWGYWGGNYPHRPHGPNYGHGWPSTYPSDRYRGTTVYSRPRYASSGERSYRPGSTVTSSGRPPATGSGSYRGNASSSASYRSNSPQATGGGVYIGPNGSYRGGQSSSSSGGSSRPGLNSRPSGSSGSSVSTRPSGSTISRPSGSTSTRPSGSSSGSTRSTRSSSSSSSSGSSSYRSGSSSSSGAYRSNSSGSSSSSYRSSPSSGSYSGGGYSGGSYSGGGSSRSSSSSSSSRSSR